LTAPAAEEEEERNYLQSKTLGQLQTNEQRASVVRLMFFVVRVFTTDG
jgi:hypothetical protein